MLELENVFSMCTSFKADGGTTHPGAGKVSICSKAAWERALNSVSLIKKTSFPPTFVSTIWQWLVASVRMVTEELPSKIHRITIMLIPVMTRSHPWNAWYSYICGGRTTIHFGDFEALVVFHTASRHRIQAHHSMHNSLVVGRPSGPTPRHRLSIFLFSPKFT